MFVRKKKNRSGTISVVVVDKSRGKFKEIKNFGVAQSELELESLFVKSRRWIEAHGGQQSIDFIDQDLKVQEAVETERVLKQVDAVLINGTQLLLNQVYDSIGFKQIKD